MTEQKMTRAMVAAVVLLGGGMFAFANMEPSDTRVLPYSGILQTGQAAATGAHDFRVGLFITDGDANASGCLLNDPPNCGLWSSEITGVDVVQGRFAVTLGETTPITDSMLAQNALYLALAVRGPGDAGFSLLDGFQRILPTPFASRAAAAKSFKVTADLSVGGDVVAGGTLAAGGDVVATGSVDVDGDVLAGGNVDVDGNVVASGDFSGSRMNLSNGVIQRGGATITQTADLGLYSSVNANWLRFVSNQGPFKFFTDGNTNAIGSQHAFSIEADGNLMWGYNETSINTALLPSRFCVVVHVNDTTCPAGWAARTTKWDTEDDSNADSKDGVVAIDDGNSASIRMRFCCRGSGL